MQHFWIDWILKLRRNNHIWQWQKCCFIRTFTSSQRCNCNDKIIQITLPTTLPSNCCSLQFVSLTIVSITRTIPGCLNVCPTNATCLCLLVVHKPLFHHFQDQLIFYLIHLIYSRHLLVVPYVKCSKIHQLAFPTTRYHIYTMQNLSHVYNFKNIFLTPNPIFDKKTFFLKKNI